jgi:hypothetical protein
VKVCCYFSIFLSKHNTCLNGYDIDRGDKTDNSKESKKVVSVEFDESEYNELIELVDCLQSQSISVVTKQGTIKFFIKYAYKQIVLEEDKK